MWRRNLTKLLHIIHKHHPNHFKDKAELGIQGQMVFTDSKESQPNYPAAFQ